VVSTLAGPPLLVDADPGAPTDPVAPAAGGSGLPQPRISTVTLS